MKVEINERKPRKHKKWYKSNNHRLLRIIHSNAKKSPAKISVKQIAKEAGVSTQTIYHHFEDVNDLISSLNAHLVDDFLVRLDKNSWRYAHYTRNHNGRIFYGLVDFMCAKKDIFRHICENVYCYALLRRFVEALYPRLKINWLPDNEPSPEMTSLRVSIYLASCVETICFWARSTGCNRENAKKCITKLIGLTDALARNQLR